MNKNIGIIIGVLVLVGIAGSIYGSMKSNDTAVVTNEQMEHKVMEDKKMTEDQGAMMKTDTMMVKGDTMMKTGSYEAYTPEKVMLASSTHNVVLFFRASWCPTCIAVDTDIKANLSKIPSNLSILDVNYDDSTALKQKYGVTYQHTFVQVDKNGTLLKKWSGSPTLTALVAEVK